MIHVKYVEHGLNICNTIGMTKATLQLTTKIRFGSIFSTVIILHNRVRKNKTKLYGITTYASSENTMLIDIVIFKYLTLH